MVNITDLEEYTRKQSWNFEVPSDDHDGFHCKYQITVS